MTELWTPSQSDPKVRVANGYLVITGAAMIRAHAILSVEARPRGYQASPHIVVKHGGRSPNNTVVIDVDTYEGARRLYDEIAAALTEAKRKDAK